MRIFQIGPHPIDKPSHGGEIRAAEIHRRLREIASVVQYAAFYMSSRRDTPLDGGIQIPTRSAWIDPDFPYLADYFAGVHLANDADAFRQLSDQLSTFKPTMIWIEELWAWPAVRRWMALTGYNCRTCYSAYNVEHEIKRKIHAAPGKWYADEADPAHLANYLNEIQGTERDFSRAADLCVAVSQDDAHTLGEMGAKRVILAPNGVARRVVEAKRLQEWQHLFGEKRYVAFVGSGHPPNAEGFWECIGGKLGFLRPDEFILAIGSVCHLLRESSQFKQLGTLAANRIQLAGVVPEIDLAALLEGGCGIILPIRTGGGTNLKTAEALATGKRIVATSTALRGFDFARRLSNVIVADDDAAFRSGIRRVLETGDLETSQPSADELEMRSIVFWDRCLASISVASLSIEGVPGQRDVGFCENKATS